MTFEDFKALSEEEQKAAYTALEEKGVLYDDMEAERDSFKSENVQLKKENAETKEEIKKTKELNFTLARSLNTGKPEKSAEDIIHDMFTGGKKT